VSKIEQSGRASLRRPKLPIKGGSAPEEEEEEEEEEESGKVYLYFLSVLFHQRFLESS